MTKKPQPMPTRTHPLDRDGDGHPGGSLPGNETAPMADALPAADEVGPHDETADQAEIADLTRPLEGTNDTLPDADEVGHQDETVDQAEDTETFTPEEIAAGHTPVVTEEGEGEVTAADTATTLPEAEPLATLETQAAPIALRLSNLQRLADNRFFYRDDHGYSPAYGPPYVDQAEVDIWLAHDLAVDSPSAGRSGGIRIAAGGRSLLSRARRGEAA